MIAFVELIANFGWEIKTMDVKVIFLVTVQHLERSKNTAGSLVRIVVGYGNFELTT